MIEKIIRIAEMAGNIIMSYYKGDQVDISLKKDRSPVTEADIASNKFIVNELESNFSYPILTEENPIPYNTRKKWTKYWLVDPLDGTKEFIERNDEFTVNIALINNHRPVVGVVNAPALAIVYWAEKGAGAYKDGKKIYNESNRKNFIGVDSISHSTKKLKSSSKVII